MRVRAAAFFPARYLLTLSASPVVCCAPPQDIFNLAFIFWLNIANFLFLHTGRHFYLFFYSTMVYFVADLVSPGVSQGPAARPPAYN